MSVKKHIEKRNVPFTQAQIFDLVADVANYKEFLPWCVASRINKKESDKIFYADLVIGYKMVRERFSSKVILESPDHIYIEYLRGPLQNLQNHWRFTQENDGSCTIDFSVEFQFKNSIMQSIAQMFFQEIVRRMVAAFEERAQQLYGDNKAS